MTYHSYRIEVPNDKRSNHVNLWFCPDIQYGNILVDKALLRKHVKQIAKDPWARVILGGDNFDAIVARDKRFQHSALDPEVFSLEAADRILSVGVMALAKELKPIKDKILCIMEGNHEVSGDKQCQFRCTEYLCRELGVEHAGYECLVGIVFDCPRRKASARYTIHCHHGSGGSQTKGGKVTRRERKAADWEDIDVHFSGHVHDPFVFSVTRLVPQFTTRSVLSGVSVKDTLCIGAGSYLKRSSIEPGQVPTDKGYRPPLVSYSEVKEFSFVKLGMRGVRLAAREERTTALDPEEVYQA